MNSHIVDISPTDVVLVQYYIGTMDTEEIRDYNKKVIDPLQESLGCEVLGFPHRNSEKLELDIIVFRRKDISKNKRKNKDDDWWKNDV